MSREKNNFKRRLFRDFKTYEKDMRNYEFKEILNRDIFIGVCDNYFSFSLLEFKRAKGWNRFYLLRYSYARHLKNIGEIKLKKLNYGQVLNLLENRAQPIITFQQAKELLFPLAMIDPEKISLWLKSYRKFYNKYLKIKRKISKIIEV